MDNSKPQVSIIIPLYNRIDFIGETLRSIEHQDYQNWEAVVVDDGSTDGSLELARQFGERDKRFRVLKRNREPKGAPVCRNIGAEISNGQLLIFLDSDDLLAPYCLKQRVKAFQQNPGKDFLVFATVIFKEQVDDLNRFWNIATEESDLKRFLRLEPVWSTTGPIYQRDFFLNVLEGFDETLLLWQDYELHVRAIYEGGRYLKKMEAEPDSLQRKHEGAKIGNADIPGKSGIMQKVIYDIFCALKESKLLNKGAIDNLKPTVMHLSLKQAEEQLSLKEPLRFLRLYTGKNNVLNRNEYFWGRLFITIRLAVKKQIIPKKLGYYLNKAIRFAFINQLFTKSTSYRFQVPYQIDSQLMAHVSD